MKLKLFKKYFLATAVTIMISFTSMLMILSFVLNNYLAEKNQATLNEACEQVVEYISEVRADSDTKLDRAVFISMLRTVAGVADADVFIVGNDGVVFICSCEEWYTEKKCMHTFKPMHQKYIGENVDVKKVHLDTLGIYETPHYYSRMILTDDEGEIVSTVFATTPISVVKNLLSSVTRLYIFSAVIPVIVMFFVIYAITYRMTKPLKLMSQAARAMAKGDFSKRIPVTSDDEIGELAASFNMMTNSLAQLEGMRRSFVANVSHELKTPMTSIGGFIDGILDGTIEPEKQTYYLDIVSQEVKRLSRLVQSMLSMARLESGEFALKRELFDLRELVFTVVIGQEQRIEQQQLEIRGLDTLEAISIEADKDLIHQAVYNLVDNAIKFTKNGGYIDFSLKTENKKTVLTVKNSGSGIPQKDLPYIFERFYKVDKSRSASKNSTGLGLYIVKTIVNAHSGTVVAASKENEYTAFKIVLP